MKPIKQMMSSFSLFFLNIYHLYHRSMRYKIIVFVTLAVLLPLSLFGGYMYSFIYENVLTQNIHRELNQSLQQINDSLVSKFRIIDNSFNLFLSDQTIRSSLEQLVSQEKTYYLKARTQLEIETQLKYSVLYDYAWNSGLIKSVFVFQDVQNYYYLFYTYLPNGDMLQDHIEFYKDSKDLDNDTPLITPSKVYKTIYFMKDIKTLITKKSLGTLVFGIDESILMKSYEHIVRNPHWKSFIYDDHHRILFHTNRDFIGETMDETLLSVTDSSGIKELFIDNTLYLVGVQKIHDMDMTSVIMVPKKELTSPLDAVVIKYLYIIILSLIIAIILSLFVVTNITKPMKDLILSIEKVHDENFTTKMPSYSYVELDEVSTTFNQMIDKIQYLFAEVYEKQILLTESELKALQAQINPHFLFNVLETISWEARMSHNEKIYHMINSLGQLLRAHLTFSSDEKVKLKEELEYVEFYLYLQKMRFDDKITINMSISNDSLLEFYVPKLCIQPLVENAIVHGLESKIEKGNLLLKILEKENGLLFEVIDDGVGFDTNKIDIDSGKNNLSGKDPRKHVGLSNVHKRIKLMYGSPYGLSIKSKCGEGTHVSIMIPFDRGEL